MTRDFRIGAQPSEREDDDVRPDVMRSLLCLRSIQQIRITPLVPGHEHRTMRIGGIFRVGGIVHRLLRRRQPQVCTPTWHVDKRTDLNGIAASIPQCVPIAVGAYRFVRRAQLFHRGLFR